MSDGQHYQFSLTRINCYTILLITFVCLCNHFTRFFKLIPATTHLFQGMGSHKGDTMYTSDDEIFVPDGSTGCRLPLFLTSVPAGFPSPADDYIELKLDLNTYLVKHPAATFFVRVSGDSMVGAGIHSGDILIVDRAIEPEDNNVVIVLLAGELTVKRIRKGDGKLILISENSSYDPIEITEDMDVETWGVVTNVIHKL